MFPLHPKWLVLAVLEQLSANEISEHAVHTPALKKCPELHYVATSVVHVFAPVWHLTQVFKSTLWFNTYPFKQVEAKVAEVQVNAPS